MSHSSCNYVTSPFADSEHQTCDRPAIRRVMLALETPREMFYCKMHWDSVKDLPIIGLSAVEDLVEEEC